MKRINAELRRELRKLVVKLWLKALVAQGIGMLLLLLVLYLLRLCIDMMFPPG